jgi:hypothetical protein
MVKINLKNVPELKRLPKGTFNIEIKTVKDTVSDDNEPMLNIKHVVIDDIEYNGCPIYKNFMPESENSLPFLIQYLEAAGLTDAEISGITDTKQFEKLLVGRKLTVSYKPSKEFNWGAMNNPRKYGDA